MHGCHRRAWVDQQATFLLFQLHSKYKAIHCEITFAHSLFTTFSKTDVSFSIYPTQIEMKTNKSKSLVRDLRKENLFSLLLHMQDSSQRATMFICIFKIQTGPASKESCIFLKLFMCELL